MLRTGRPAMLAMRNSSTHHYWLGGYLRHVNEGYSVFSFRTAGYHNAAPDTLNAAEDELYSRYRSQFSARLDDKWRPVGLDPDRALTEVLEECPVNELKRMLKRYGLPLQGIKRDLVARLVSCGAIPTDYDEYEGIIQAYEKKGTVESYHECVAALQEMLQSVELVGHMGGKDEVRERLSKLTVKQLAMALKEVGAPVSGLKADLITRCIDTGISEEALKYRNHTSRPVGKPSFVE